MAATSIMKTIFSIALFLALIAAGVKFYGDYGASSPKRLRSAPPSSNAATSSRPSRRLGRWSQRTWSMSAPRW
jgi:hypothetical protein